MQLIRTLKLVTALALVSPGARLVGQQQPAAPPAAPAKTGKAEISGIVFDSLNARFLPGADVIIQGAQAANLVSDSAGRFKIDGLPPGTYQVGVFHPLLDTLGISVASQPFRVGPDSTSIVILSVPPAATIIRRSCPPPLSNQGNSAVIGHVNDPETLQPVAGAEVSIAWIQIEISKQAGFSRTPHVLRDTTNGAGAFHICGLPNSMQATLQARKGTAATSAVPISLGDANSELFARALLLSLSASRTTAGNATVSGRVVLVAIGLAGRYQQLRERQRSRSGGGLSGPECPGAVYARPGRLYHHRSLDSLQDSRFDRAVAELRPSALPPRV